MEKAVRDKELFAGAIHARSQRAHRQFVAVDCSTLSPTLLESELFGHVRGAFTGAVRDKEGIFDMVSGGTLFMDHVTNLSLEIQGKLLRVLETGEYKPVGASHIQKTDVRIIAATNRNLKAMVEEGQFRDDLFYRLNVFPIFIPPLRERKDDIPLLAAHFLSTFSLANNKVGASLDSEAIEALMEYDWPGNVRELENAIERAVVLCPTETIDIGYLPRAIRDCLPPVLRSAGISTSSRLSGCSSSGPWRRPRGIRRRRRRSSVYHGSSSGPR